MVVNWTPENIINFIVCIAFLFETFFFFRKYNPPNLRVISYFRALWVAGFFFYFFEGLASLVMESIRNFLTILPFIFSMNLKGPRQTLRNIWKLYSMLTGRNLFQPDPAACTARESSGAILPA